MAHDPERTRALLLAAAIGEFSSHGFAGARIERISAAAGVNRERLYSYFGNKRTLFETVLADRLAASLDAIVVRGAGPDAAAAFAGDYFDVCRSTLDLPRLVSWEGLELGQPIEADDRRSRASRKVQELSAALPSLSREEVEDLMLTVVTLCHGWFTSPNLGRIVSEDETDHARRRAVIVGVASRAAGDEEP